LDALFLVGSFFFFSSWIILDTANILGLQQVIKAHCLKMLTSVWRKMKHLKWHSTSVFLVDLCMCVCHLSWCVYVFEVEMQCVAVCPCVCW